MIDKINCPKHGEQSARWLGDFDFMCDTCFWEMLKKGGHVIRFLLQCLIEALDELEPHEKEPQRKVVSLVERFGTNSGPISMSAHVKGDPLPVEPHQVSELCSMSSRGCPMPGERVAYLEGVIREAIKILNNTNIPEKDLWSLVIQVRDGLERALKEGE